ncbi:MAG: DUF3784 domain-containing protein [Clostridiales bacterium]|nr:DUF3784 domain-containing protein [Clostridiales bacterium]
MEEWILLVIGLLISALGIVNITGNVSTIHAYNRRKVKEEDITKYGRVMGIGTLIIGISLVVAFALTLLDADFTVDIIVIPAIVIGVAIMLYGQFRYNGGIF